MKERLRLLMIMGFDVLWDIGKYAEETLGAIQNPHIRLQAKKVFF